MSGGLSALACISALNRRARALPARIQAISAPDRRTRRPAGAHNVLICTVSGLRELGPTTASNGGSAGVLRPPSLNDGYPGRRTHPTPAPGIVDLTVCRLRSKRSGDWWRRNGWTVAVVRGWLLCRLRLTGIVSLGVRWPGPLEPDPQPGEVRCGH